MIAYLFFFMNIPINTIKYAVIDWKSAEERYRVVLELMCMWCREGYVIWGRLP